MNDVPKTNTSTAGFTIIENIFAVGIIALGFAGLYALSAQCMRIMHSSREEMAAMQSLQDRGDSLRKCTWVQITNPTYLSSNIMNTAANNAPLTDRMTETVTINAYPTALNPAIKLTRSGAGVVTVVSSNSAIANGDLLNINIQMSWTSWSGNRPHTAAMSTTFAENTR